MKILMSTIDFCVDSKNRNTNEFPNPNMYSIDLPTTYKGVHSIEIHRCHIPQSQYEIDVHNNKLYYQFANSTLNCISIAPCNTIQSFINVIRNAINPAHISFTFYKKRVIIHNNFCLNVKFHFSKHDSIGHVLGFPADIEIEHGGEMTGYSPIAFQKEPCVFMTMNGLSNIENPHNKSIIYKHNFNKFYEHRQIKECTPVIGKLFRLDIAFTNYNDELYNFNGYNHTFNIRIKCS